jgi:hypothetical protein
MTHFPGAVLRDSGVDAPKRFESDLPNNLAKKFTRTLK